MRLFNVLAEAQRDALPGLAGELPGNKRPPYTCAAWRIARLIAAVIGEIWQAPGS